MTDTISPFSKTALVLFLVQAVCLFPTGGWGGDLYRIDEIASDGTLSLGDGIRLRLSGLYPDDLRTSVGMRALSDLLLSRYVRIGTQEYEDRHGRRVVHLWRDDDVWIQGALVAAGLVRVYLTVESGTDDERLVTVENEARLAERGGWQRLDAWKMTTPEMLDHRKNGPALVEGLVHRASEWKGTVYLNFGDDSRRTFTVLIPRTLRRELMKRGHDPLHLQGCRLRVRGWLSWKARPEMTVRHPGQIEEIP